MLKSFLHLLLEDFIMKRKRYLNVKEFFTPSTQIQLLLFKCYNEHLWTLLCIYCAFMNIYKHYWLFISSELYLFSKKRFSFAVVLIIIVCFCAGFTLWHVYCLYSSPWLDLSFIFPVKGALNLPYTGPFLLKKLPFSERRNIMKKKGFFKINKMTLLFLCVILLLDIIMFTPGPFYGHTSVGTSVQFVFVNVILFLAPSLALVDGLIKSKLEEDAAKKQSK